MKKKSIFFRVLFVLLFIVLLSLWQEKEVYGTTYKGARFNGTVTDETGNGIPGITIELENITNGNIEATAYSGSNGQYEIKANELSDDMEYQIKLIYPDGEYYTTQKMEQKMVTYQKNTSRQKLKIQVISNNTEILGVIRKKLDTVGIELSYYKKQNQGNITEAIREMGDSIGSTLADNVILYFGEFNETDKDQKRTREARGYPRVDIFQVEEDDVQAAIDAMLNNTCKNGENYLAVKGTQNKNLGYQDYSSYTIGKQVQVDTNIQVDVILKKEAEKSDVIQEDPAPSKTEDQFNNDFAADEDDEDDFNQLTIQIGGECEEEIEVRIYRIYDNGTEGVYKESRWNLKKGTYQISYKYFEVGNDNKAYYYVRFYYNGEEYQADSTKNANEENYENGDPSKTNSRSWVNANYRSMTREKEEELDNADSLSKRTVIAQSENQILIQDITTSEGDKRAKDRYYVNLDLNARENFNLSIEKEISHVKIILADGTVSYDDGFNESVPGQQIVFMDDEIMHGATVQVEYKIKVKNESTNIDCTGVTLVDYIDQYYKGITYDPECSGTQGKNSEYGWQVVENKDELRSYLVDFAQIADDECIVKTSINDPIPAGKYKEIYLTTSQVITTDCDAAYQNEVKVIGYQNNGGRRNGVRNNYQKVGYNDVLEANSQIFTILPPFGNTNKREKIAKTNLFLEVEMEDLKKGGLRRG